MSIKELNSDTLEIIIAETERIRKECHIVNPVLRDDVFALLESKCTVLYFPLEGEDINGFRTRKIVNGEYQDFVYINTANPVEKQIFTAAHELGHVLAIDEKVSKQGGMECGASEYRETIINRFAAELVMPQSIFKDVYIAKMKLSSMEGKIPIANLLNAIIDTMNYFLVPYKAVVLRIHEIGYASVEACELLLDEKTFSKQLINSLIENGNFKRLNRPTMVKNIDEIVRYAKELDERDLISEKKLDKVIQLFDIKDFELEIPSEIQDKIIDEQDIKSV